MLSLEHTLLLPPVTRLPRSFHWPFPLRPSRFFLYNRAAGATFTLPSIQYALSPLPLPALHLCAGA